jgi:sterol desaturase/sphingolipid hydroxylase (fatty acid hydroxylase superfamily)
MLDDLFSATAPQEYVSHVRRGLPVLLLALFWCWETWRPFFGQREGRLLHAGRNLTLSLFNTVAVGLAFGYLLVSLAGWTQANQLGLLNQVGLAWGVRLLLGLVLLDCWMYFWHRANHALPILWRFHRMHHSDPHMDVTTATRFHLGEQVLSTVLRLALIPLLGLEIWHLLIYDTLAVAVTQFHHADISLGRWDRWLCRVIVTPDMHKVHHSDWQPETDSNYSTVLSIWDRLFGSYRWRNNPGGIVFGLKEYTDPAWQSLKGMLLTPLVNPPHETPPEGWPTDSSGEFHLVSAEVSESRGDR